MFKIHHSIPSKYSSRGTAYGSNSKVYFDIINELKERENEVEEIHLALYLFNNAYLYRELLKLAEKGAKVVVTSLPLTGYDRRKIEDAKRVYSRVHNDDKIELLIFPHTYMWYGALYAGGGASYSFHVKAGLIKYKDGTSKVFLTSGNLAPGDPTHSETAVFVETPNSSPYINSFELFFEEVENRAKPYKDYVQRMQGLSINLQKLFEFPFTGGLSQVSYSPAPAFFTAPFITVSGKGSNHYAREKIVNLIQSAKRRVLLCAQHVHDISPFDDYTGTTVIQAIMEIKRKRPNMDVRVLKQVSSSGLADKRRAAFVEGHLHYANISQKTNKLIHDKFVVADDAVLLTTSNFTTTQFGWGARRMTFRTGISDLGKVKEVVDEACSFFQAPRNLVRSMIMRKRKGKPEVKVVKEDIFSEVNGFITMESRELANQMANYFKTLWSHKLSSDVNIPI